MGDPRRLRPDEVEIFVARELRKAGLELASLRERARRRPAKDDDEYVMELAAVLRVEGAERRVVVECRNERQPVGAEAVTSLAARLAEAEPEPTDAPRRLMPAPAAAAPTPPPPRLGVLFSASGYEADAVRAARARGVALLTVADGKAAFARTQGGMAGDPPAWVPEYMSEVVDLDAAGAPRHRLVVAGNPRLILDRLTPAAG